MATFNAESAAQQARTGSVPPEWAVYPLRAVSAWATVALMVGLAALGFGLAIYTLSSGLTTGEVSAPAWLFALVPDSGTIYILVGEVLGLAALGLLGAVAAVPTLFAALNRRDHFLLITPEGFALVNGSKARGASYADVVGMARSNGSLTIKLRGGKSMRVSLSAYGRPDELHALLVSNRRAALQPGGQGR